MITDQSYPQRKKIRPDLLGYYFEQCIFYFLFVYNSTYRYSIPYYLFTRWLRLDNVGRGPMVTLICKWACLNLFRDSMLDINNIFTPFHPSLVMQINRTSSLCRWVSVY